MSLFLLENNALRRCEKLFYSGLFDPLVLNGALVAFSSTDDEVHFNLKKKNVLSAASQNLNVLVKTTKAQKSLRAMTRKNQKKRKLLKKTMMMKKNVLNVASQNQNVLAKRAKKKNTILMKFKNM